MLHHVKNVNLPIRRSETEDVTGSDVYEQEVVILRCGRCGASLQIVPSSGQTLRSYKLLSHYQSRGAVRTTGFTGQQSIGKERSLKNGIRVLYLI